MTGLVFSGVQPTGNLHLGNYLDAIKKIGQESFINTQWDWSAIPDWNAAGTNAPKEMILITQSLKEMKLLMSDYVLPFEIAGILLLVALIGASVTASLKQKN